MLLNGHGYPVTMIAVCAAAALAAPIALLLWWRRTRSAASVPNAEVALRRGTGLVIASSLPMAVAMVIVVRTVWFGPHDPLGLLGFRITGWVAALTPCLGLVLMLLVHGLGEWVWPRPSGARRRASLGVRTPDSLVPGVRRTVRAWYIALVAVCVGLGITASSVRGAARLDGYTGLTVEPYPGWLWTGPLLIAATLVMLLLEATLRALADRPAVPGVPPSWDLWLRRQTARRLTNVVQLVLGLSIAGLLTVAGSAMHLLGRGFGGEGGSWATTSTTHLVLGVALHVVSVASALLAAVMSLRPARDEPPLIDESAEQLVKMPT